MNKKMILLLALLLTTKIAFGQIRFYHIIDVDKIKLKQGFILQKVVTISPDSTKPYETKKITEVSLCGIKRKGIISSSGGTISLDLWQIKDGKTCGEEGVDNTTSLKSTQFKFSDSRSTIGHPTKVMWIPYRTITIGLNTLPFRYRFPVKINDSTTIGLGAVAFSLALNIGYTFGWSAITTRVLNNYSITLGGYVGPAVTDLKKSVYRDQSKWVGDQTNATITYGFNIIFARNNLGVVLGLGAESALGKNADQWVYNGQPYIAFGVNTSFGR